MKSRSDLDLEPNPFEKSFGTPSSSNVRNASPTPDDKVENSGSSKSSSDSSAQDDKSARADRKRSPSPTRPVLPPLASISSPADPSYAWSYNNNALNSLRSGPLSPAMLAGPQQSQDQPSHLAFDPASFRTGLTPRSGFTPGLTPLVGGPGAFPSAAPNAAYLNMVANGSTSTLNGTITPNTINALSGVINGGNLGYHNQGAHQDNANPNFLPSSHAASQAANGLFLLSQAHQELEKREASAQQADTAASAATNGAQLNGKRKRKSHEAASPPPPPKNGKRTRSTANSGRRKTSPRSEGFDDDEDDGEDDEGFDQQPDENSSSNKKGAAKKPETEEEKRRNFLERNRQAALKCRQRKKAWLQELQATNEFLKSENEQLKTALVASRDEISRLSQLVGGAGVAGSMPISVNNSGVTSGVHPISMNVSIPNKSTGSNTGRTSGYGY